VHVLLSFLQRDAHPAEAIGHRATGPKFADLALACQLLLAFDMPVSGRKLVSGSVSIERGFARLQELRTVER
jgi:hypothetical protein